MNLYPSHAGPPLPAVKPFMLLAHEARDVFLRDIRIHYLPYSGEHQQTRQPIRNGCSINGILPIFQMKD